MMAPMRSDEKLRLHNRTSIALEIRKEIMKGGNEETLYEVS